MAQITRTELIKAISKPVVFKGIVSVVYHFKGLELLFIEVEYKSGADKIFYSADKLPESVRGFLLRAKPSDHYFLSFRSTECLVEYTIPQDDTSIKY